MIAVTTLPNLFIPSAIAVLLVFPNITSAKNVRAEPTFNGRDFPRFRKTT